MEIGTDCENGQSLPTEMAAAGLIDRDLENRQSNCRQDFARSIEEIF